MSQPDNSASYRFGDWLVEPSRNRLTRNGLEVALEPKSIEVLCYLLERPGVVVSADELIEQVWPGRVIESNTLHRHVMHLRHALADDAHHPSYIETIPKRGYRTIAEVNTGILRADLVDGYRSSFFSRSWVYIAMIAGLAMALSGGVWWLSREPEYADNGVQQRTEVLANSIAVLPFQNLSPDPDYAYFAAGIHEEVLIELGKIPGLSVIARMTMLKYADSEKSPHQIARELNVSAIMAGSVRYSGDQVRVTVQLVDAASGAQLWSDAYQERLQNVIDIQVAIAHRIVTTLELPASEDGLALVGKPLTTNAAAYAHYLRANSLVSALDPVGPVLSELDRAIELDPEFAAAYAAKGFFMSLTYPWPDRHVTNENLLDWADQARQNANRALEINPDEARALLTLGMQAGGSLRSQEGRGLIARAYELAPNDIFTINFMSIVRLAQNRGADVIALEEKKMALDPLNFFHPYTLSGHAWWLEEYDIAEKAAQKTISMSPNTFHGYLASARAAAGRGDIPTALQNLETAIELGGTTPSRGYVTASAASIYYQLSMAEQAADMLAELEFLAANQYVPPFARLLAYVGSSEVDMMVHWLSMAMNDGRCSSPCWNILNLSHHRAFDGVRDHPRFRSLVKGE